MGDPVRFVMTTYERLNGKDKEEKKVEDSVEDEDKLTMTIEDQGDIIT